MNIDGLHGSTNKDFVSLMESEGYAVCWESEPQIHHLHHTGRHEVPR